MLLDTRRLGSAIRNLCLVMVLLCPEAIALDGNKYLDLKEREQGWFLLGLIEGMKYQPTASDKNNLQASNCVSGLPLKQVHAIIAKWLANNPEYWGMDMIDVFNRALQHLCSLNQYKPDRPS